MTENNDNRNTITYDDDWKSVSYSEYPKVSEELDSDEEDVNSLSAENSDEKKNSPKQLVITIQLGRTVRNQQTRGLSGVSLE